MIKIYISMVAGLMLSMPVILYQIWQFISPAIEKKVSVPILAMFLMSSVFFIFGAYFSYSMIVPLSITFFTSLSSSYVPVDYNITLENYMTYVIWIILVGGLIFQLPIVSIIFKFQLYVGLYVIMGLNHFRKSGEYVFESFSLIALTKPGFFCSIISSLL